MINFTRNGFWVKQGIDGEIIGVYKVENEYETYVYVEGDWIAKGFIAGIGIDDDFSKIPEDEALALLGLSKW